MREWFDFSIPEHPAYDLMQGGRCIASVECTTTTNGIRWYWYTNDRSSLLEGTTYDDAESAQRAIYTILRSNWRTPNNDTVRY